MESQTVLALKDNGGSHPNQKLQPEERRGALAKDAAKRLSEIKTVQLLAHESAGGRRPCAARDIKTLEKLFFLVTVCSRIAGVDAQIPDGSWLKTFATTYVKVAAGTIAAIAGTFVIAAWWMRSRRSAFTGSAFTEAEIMDGLTTGPAVARRSDLTFEIHPSF